MNKGGLIAVFTIACVMALDLVAQQAPIEFKHFTTAEGLSQSSVITMTQDQQGMLWFGTRDGLNRYDGNKISVFRNNAQDPNSISNNDILDIAVDATGDLWIGTYNGLNHYNLKTERFTHYFKDQSTQKSISNNTIWSIDILPSGEILLGTADGLNVLNPDTDTFVSYYHDPSNPKSVSHSHVLKIFTDSKNQTWVGTEAGLNRMTQQADGSYVFDRINLGNSEDSGTDFIQAITEDQQGSIWVGSKSNGLYELSPQGELKAQFKKEARESSLINNNVRALEIDKLGRLWVGTYDGLSRMEHYGIFLSVRNDTQSQNSISENKIKSIYCTDNGSVWVGTYYGGLNMWDQSNFNFGHIKQQNVGEGLAYNVVSSIIDNSSYLYFGTEGSGITALEKQTGEYSYYNQQNAALSSNNIKAMRWNQASGDLWVCTFNAGLNVFNTTTNQVTQLLDVNNGLSNNSVYDVVAISEEEWLLGTFGGGLNLYNHLTQEIKWIMNDPNDPKSLSDDQVRTLMKDSKGNIWIGTQNGLSFLSAQHVVSRSFQFERYFYDAESKSGEDVLVIFESKDHTIWVGTKETGLHQLTDEGFVTVDLFSGYESTSNIIHSIEEDNAQALWIGSNNGIMRYEPQSATKKLFEESDGLLSNEFNSNASLYSISGKMYFGGPAGVSWFDPRDLKENLYTPNVTLTGLKINNRRVIPGDETEVLSTALSTMRRIVLDYDQANFTLEFALPSFVNPDKNMFVYRMKGLEEEWNFSSVPEVSYAIQNSNSYLFEIKGINNDGNISSEITKLHIYVHPAPWKSVTAFMLYGLIVIVALYILYRMIKSKARLQYELDLEHRINLQQQEMNQVKLQFFTNISHEFRTPLTLILGPLEQIIQDYKGSSSMFKKLKVMEQSASQLLKLINQLMDFRKIENKQANLEAAEGNLVKFVHEIFLSFKILAKNGGYKYTFESDQEDIRVYYDRDKLERVLYNLLSNAFKFTPEGGEVKVQISEKEGQVDILVADSGQGIEPENLDKIFDRFYQVRSGSRHQETSKGTGIGLALAKSIIDLHKGSLEVESQLEVGSQFTIKLAKGKDHLDDSQVIGEFKDSEDLTNYRMDAVDDWNSKTTLDVDRLIREEDKKTVLVVEDNDHVRGFILELLSGEYNLIEASNGQMGMEMALAEVPDLIISDVMMPVMDGIEFCSQIKSNLKTSHIPFILLTARTSLIFKYEGLESGADEYINKPFNVRELELKVRNLLRFVANLKKKFRDNKQITPSEITITSIDEELLNKAIEVMNDNIENQFFDVALFASELGVSRTMLFTKVKAWTDMTPNDFILSMRMKRAAQLLEQGKINVSQVSYKVGFKNPKYFTKCFQKYHHTTPSAYAEKFS
ncbi:ATP-binding protein [Reichenbachiella agarivorans]|uniref:histidine kinase n=1 Tax=Reichenbachiella agarivorans TaxID=2979464 RepID=A0ABY6CQI1_9BACT|nr:two-component regulator propeller domain-containing protein [Reichenbachiella agarivorans]UXP32778.1 ATP-binding protein [Reichenbachiella agarivorans]